ncbi:DUF1592 domain-containing protein [Planctomicrobium sp. SH668]|uniref:DUF1592 domain-containing protein n=1 Tax=Planctomicrobium sp. SH668 TaxID=3448126 RepID=UPI003F5C5C4A
MFIYKRNLVGCAVLLCTLVTIAFGLSDTICLAQEDGEHSESFLKGKAVYTKLCAHCHGAAGEGTPDYSIALTGDKSVLELTDLIDRTMPEGEPELCSAEEARDVAAYIHNEFYSPLAQARIRPATVDFSRLTVRQFENSVTDVLRSFQTWDSTSKENGLKAAYYNLRWFDEKKRVIERTDPEISFSFGAEKPAGFPSEPDTEKRAADDIHDELEFSIQWTGSVYIPKTGDYEFILESENGVRLFLNDNQKELIDAWVASGTETSHRGTTHLLGGRRYAIRVEFFRYKQPTASIKLKWKRPGFAEEVIPTRFLFKEWAPELFVINTPFPPDDRSSGYERGTTISKGWKEAVIQASLETGDYVSSKIPTLAGLGENDENRAQKIRDFSIRFVTTAFRRPLSEEQIHELIDRQLTGVSEEIGVKRVVLRTLMSPAFLYREHGHQQFDQYSMASWLSFTLWDSIPDQALLDAAGRGELETEEQISQQVERMLGDYRSKTKLLGFLQQWLRLDHMVEIVKDQKVHTGFDHQMVSDLQASLELFLDEVINSPEADLKQFFLDDGLYLNGRLATYYGADLPADSPLQRYVFEGQARSGVLTHPLLLAGFAYDLETSPIHRGVFISRSLLGRRLKPPPEAVAPLAPDLHAGLTTRERVLIQTSPNSCQTCHTMINDLGFSLEHFDASGRYRSQDKNQEINDAGSYVDRFGTETSFHGSRELAEFLASSPETREAFTEQLFQYLVKQPVRAFGPEELSRQTQRFADSGTNIRTLMKNIVVSSALGARQLERQKSTASVNH